MYDFLLLFCSDLRLTETAVELWAIKISKLVGLIPNKMKKSNA